MADAVRVGAPALRAMLLDGGELALIDVREERIFSENHLLFARSVPLSRLELRMARLVPRKATRIVLVDDGDGLAERAAKVLIRAGYSSVHILDGGNAAWSAAGFELFSGVNVPSKAFGEFVEHESGTPSISADELHALMQSGADMVVLDSRPYDEYSRVSIPTGVNVPGAELVLRIHDIAPKPETLVVVNCAGRTRSIIGAQSLINAGVPNKVVALRNGTMGWNLAGFTPDSGKDFRAPAVTAGGLAWAKAKTGEVARKLDIERIDEAMLARLRADESRTLYLFDVRDPAEYAAGHVAGALSAPGGQLVQATDQYAGTLGARIVCVDDKQARAVMTASWLRQMGWREVYVLVASGSETGFPENTVLGEAPKRCRDRCRGAERLAAAHRRDCHRPFSQPPLSGSAYSRRMVRDPIEARPGARQDQTGRHSGAHVGGRRACRSRGRRRARAHGAAGALSRGRQRRVARRRISVDGKTIRAWRTSRSMPGSSPTSAPTA